MLRLTFFLLVVSSSKVLCVDTSDYTNYCHDLALADGLYADPFDCGHFIECSNFETSHMACPHGLAFNVNLKVCDDAHNADCDFNMDDASLCFANRWENGIHPYPDDCSKFIECTFYKTDIMPCPPDLVYDAYIQTCVRQIPGFVCDTSGHYTRPTTSSTTTTTTTTTTSTTTTRKPINYKTFCKEFNVPDGDYPDPFDCGKYIECKGLETYRLSCPAGQNFNTVSMSCSDASTVDCSLNYYYNFNFDSAVVGRK